ncbi:hypothetical protein BKA70DRAFT_1410946 [Coprinopsis sp. MPI-PUGE-AT-0042]|nr:hypothetical protein BKA70DRAFT_1410946 [Coprinopsis sp. MPI-PUGE-AT-0042]
MESFISSKLASLLGSNRPATTSLLAVLPLLFVLYRAKASLLGSSRQKKVPRTGERVVVLGASSGIGQSIARQYAERGARVLVVGRRGALVDEVVGECLKAREAGGLSEVVGHGKSVLGFTGDFTNVEDMVRLRGVLSNEWHGIDTLIVAAGVSALQPLLAIAGYESGATQLTSAEGIHKVKNVAIKAIEGNYLGPLVAAVTFIPLLSSSSSSPSILLVNSLASVIPAPTRTLYASTKSASLLLYQALSIEHPNITFSHILPSTVEGDFRASAVDSGPVREKDPNKHGLKREDVARACIRAVDRGEKNVFLPKTMWWGHLLYWIVPGFVEKKAMKKYDFKV